MIAPFREISAVDRCRALDAYDDLLDAACEAYRHGWRCHERDVIAAEARRLGLTVWPALLDRITREATASTYTYL
ncbi:MAG: hypothetical protein JWR63_1069 [Conexibacter sp.]|nr:hypothetical protein [Conexibacter sp.]